jgi:predicted nucleic acid-binding protein
MQKVILDSGPLGRIAHPNRNQDTAEWLTKLLDSGVTVYLPEIADYEVRRSLLLGGLDKSVKCLDELKLVLEYRPLTTQAMQQAAQFWADIRKQHRRTADDKALDGDVILAAQAREVDAVVVTDNVKHINKLVSSVNWKDM